MKTFSIFTLMTILSLLLLAISNKAFAFKNTPLTPINNLFDAMRMHDGDKLLAQFTKRATLTRATKKNAVKISDINKFANSITKSTKHLDEKLFNITIKQSGNLASVWAPFAFYVEGKLSHCGVNSFQLIQQNGYWKIHSLIDNVYQGDCKSYIKQEQGKL